MADRIITTKVEETDSGLLIPKTEILSKRPHYVKDGGKGVFIVVDGNGAKVRVYKKIEGCKDPKAAAESYAEKLSKKYQ
ncbi:MAG: hypothetical protein CSYNP_03119 [Syntrophus sp. SKADARSKE-3]|nr:hypothetical protein [Syntrophus sp. SKADARSKE-3]